MHEVALKKKEGENAKRAEGLLELHTSASWWKALLQERIK